MKKILVPTDFSSNADTAVQYALQVAERDNVPVHLIHTYQVNQSALVFKDLGSIMAKDAEEQMQASLNHFRAEFSHPDQLTGEVIRGSLLQTLAGFDRDHLVVMGTRGATDALEVFIGSTTGAVLKQSIQPVLAIPAGFQYRPFHKIVLALGSEPLPPAEVFQVLGNLASSFSSSIDVFHIKKGENDSINPAIRDHLGQDLTLAFHEVLNSDQWINDRINDFVASQNADLLCMVRRSHGFLKSLFEGSATTRQVYDSPVPLLVLMGAKNR